MGKWRTGHLDEIITIEKETSSGQDSLGQPITTWSTHIKCFARVSPLTSRERFRGERFVFEDMLFFVIRWVTGITPNMRVAYDDASGRGVRYFNIRNIAELDDGRKRFIELTGEAQE